MAKTDLNSAIFAAANKYLDDGTAGGGEATAANQAAANALLTTISGNVDGLETSLTALTNGSGITATASFTPVAAAYSANDIMGASMEFNFTYAASGLEIPDTSLIRILTAVLRIDETALVASEGAYALQLYSATQPSAQNDNDAWTLASGDLLGYRGSFSLGTPVDLGSACYVRTSNVDHDARLLTGSLWARLQTTAGFTVGATPPVRQVTLYGVAL